MAQLTHGDGRGFDTNSPSPAVDAISKPRSGMLFVPTNHVGSTIDRSPPHHLESTVLELEGNVLLGHEEQSIVASEICKPLAAHVLPGCDRLPQELLLGELSIDP